MIRAIYEFKTIDRHDFLGKENFHKGEQVICRCSLGIRSLICRPPKRKQQLCYTKHVGVFLYVCLLLFNL